MNFCGLRSVKRKPAALNLHHDAMAGAEGVRDVGHGEGDAVGLAGLERHGLLEALAELAAERLAADQLLVAAHEGHGGGGRRAADRPELAPERCSPGNRRGRRR